MLHFSTKEECSLVKETAKLYQHILRYSPDGFLLIDMDGRILDVNESFCSMLGYTRKEMLRFGVADIEAFENPSEVLKHLRKVKRKGNDRFVTQHRDRRGTLVDVEVSVFYSNDLGGLLVVFVRDIRERKEAERILEVTRDRAKKRLEQLLVDSYKHIGVINRKISLLLELERSPKSEMGRRETTEYVLRIAMKVSGSNAGLVYISFGRGKYRLLACRGVKKSDREMFSEISSRKNSLLRYLHKEKRRFNGCTQHCETGMSVIEKRHDYFVALPLMKEDVFSGFILLWFDKIKSIETQELEFLDIFALHTSKVLSRMRIL